MALARKREVHKRSFKTSDWSAGRSSITPALNKQLPPQTRHYVPGSMTATLLPRGQLVDAKLRPPQLASVLVERAGLLGAMARGSHKKLLLMVAPIGSGKTTLLRQWRDSESCRPIAWLSIDEHDNDPRRFFSYLVAAVRKVVRGFEGYVSGALQDLADLRVHQISAVLLESLSRMEHDLVVVLDDFQWISDPEIVRAFSRLVRHSPPQVHWMVSSRCRPDLSLGELTLQDQLELVGPKELDFIASDIADLSLRLHARALAPTDADELHHRTEGWVAGVKLALLTVDDPARIGVAVRSFNGSHEAVARYLAGAVLQDQPPELREFLLVSSIVDKMNGDLCNTLLGIPDAQQMLERLERSQLFLHALDSHRGTYRYHLLFRNFLRDALLRERPDRIAALHKTASQWFARHGMTHEALTHAFSAGDRTWCIDVTGRCALMLMKSGETPEILRWSELLSLSEILSNEDLSCAYIMSLILARRFGDAASALRQALARVAQVSHTSGQTGGLLASRLKLLELMLYADTADGPLMGEDLPVDGDAGFFAGLLMATQTARLLYDNEFDAMRRMAMRASEIGRACGSPYLSSHCETVIAVAHVIQGNLAAAARTCERNFELHKDSSGSPAWAIAALGLACTHYERSKLGPAQALFTEILPFISAASRLRNFLLSYGILARLKGLEQKDEEAFQLLDHAHSVVEKGGHPRFLAQICFEKVRLQLERNDMARAASTVHEFGLLERARRGEWSRTREYEEGWIRYGFSLALFWMHEQRFVDARGLLHVLRASAEKAGRINRQMSLEMALAVCHWRAGRSTAAFSVLNRCIVPAQQLAFGRSIFDETPRLPALLGAIISAGKLHYLPPSRYFKQYTGVTRTKKATPVPQAKVHAFSPTAPLTEREILILILVSKGFCNKAISATSRIALNTIKWHLRNAFAKLEVSTRTGAVARARELGLIE